MVQGSVVDAFLREDWIDLWTKMTDGTRCVGAAFNSLVFLCFYNVKQNTPLGHYSS